MVVRSCTPAATRAEALDIWARRVVTWSQRKGKSNDGRRRQVSAMPQNGSVATCMSISITTSRFAHRSTPPSFANASPGCCRYNPCMDKPAEEDPRVYFAAERTFLAWIRTGLGLMGVGFAVSRFGLFLRELSASASHLPAQTTGLSLWSGVMLVAMGVVVTLSARFVRHYQKRAAFRNMEGGAGVHRCRDSGTGIGRSWNCDGSVPDPGSLT